MSIELTTPSSLKTYSSGSLVTFFDHNSISLTSHTFTVNQEPYYIEGFNLTSADVVTVQMVNDAGGTPVVTDYIPIKDKIQLTSARTKIRIDYPGTYHLVYTGPAVGAITVKGFSGTMTHESTTELADALYSALVILGGNADTVIGAPPITVTGIGSVASPYTIGITAASLPEMEAAVSVNEINTANLTNFINCTTATSRVRVGINSTAADGGTAVGKLAYAYTNSVAIGLGAGGDGGGGHTATGSGNIFIGRSTGANSSGDENIALGFQATESSNCTLCVALGSSSSSDMIGFANVAIGNESADSVRGSHIVAVGDNALFQNIVNTIAIDSTIAIGYNAFARAVVSNAIAIGVSAGHISSQTGIFIGYRAGDANTNVNTIIIGNGIGFAAPLNATADNQIILGNSTQTQLVTAGSVISGGVIVPSDERLKKDIHPYDGGLNIVMSMDPVTFKWDEEKLEKSKVPYLKSDIDKEQCGVIAQQLQVLVPSAIAESGPDNNLFVHYDRLVPYLISAIKELSNEVADLKKRID